MAHNPPSVAIIGGGFSGIMVLYHLVRLASHPLHIYWYDAQKIASGGIAYGKAEAPHLLNVRTDKMGAVAGEAEGFYQWLVALCEADEVTASSFQPRIKYKEYLHTLLKETLAIAVIKKVEIFAFQKEITTLSDLPAIEALVLATGTPAPRRFNIPPHIPYIADSWKHPLPYDIAEWPEDSQVGIIGTSLTAIDTILSLKQKGYRGKILAFSRHGWLPAEHQACTTLPVWHELLTAPENLSSYQLFRTIKKRAKIMMDAGGDWRSVIDSLRPITPTLWQMLPLKEKRRFLQKLFSLWNVHRHRISPEVGKILRELQASGRLEIIAASLHTILANNTPQLLINCTGPDFDITRNASPLLHEMLANQTIQADELKLGLALEIHSTKAKRNSLYPIFPMGTLTLGSYFETIAVPELREQALSVAQNVWQKVSNATQ